MATLARKLKEQSEVAQFTRIVREAMDATDEGWSTIWDRGRAQGTYSGGQRQRFRQFPLIRDRDEGRFYPFYEEERDLEEMRNKCRDLATFTSVSVGAMLALRCYTLGGEWDYKPIPKEDAEQQPSPELLREVAVIVKANLDRNNWIGDLDGEIHDVSREDGEALVAGYATPDGLADFRRLEIDHLRAPANPGALNRWLGTADREASWTFGVQTVFDHRMRRIDHERHAGYHCVFVDGGSQWDYLPAWPQAVGDDELDGKFLHQIKRNTPRKAKRGISDYWPVLDDLERGKKLSVNLSVGAAVLAAIPWIETFPKGTTRDQAQNQLTRAMDTFSRSLTLNRGSERSVLNMAPGTPLKVSSGKEYTAGPMGQVRQPVYIEVHQHICRAIGLRWLMPEYMISGDASNANYSSTLVAESPFVKAREGDQQFYVAHFKLILLKALKLAHDAGRFRRYGVQSWGHFLAMIDLAIQPPMVASRDKAQQLAELRDLWTAGLIDGNEYRIDLKREPKPELEGKTGGGPSPEEMQAALAGQAPLGGQQPPPDDPNGQPAKPQPPQPQGPQGAKGGQPGGQQPGQKPVDRKDETRSAAFGKAVAEARTIDEARALGRAILESRRVREASDCGANADGGGGFQPGNDCQCDDCGGAGGGDNKSMNVSDDSVLELMEALSERDEARTDSGDDGPYFKAGDRVSDAGRKLLQQAFPGAKIAHDGNDGHNSFYFDVQIETVDDYATATVRISDHANTSRQHGDPGANITLGDKPDEVRRQLAAARKELDEQIAEQGGLAQ